MTAANVAGRRLLLANADVVTPERVVAGGTVVVEDGRIADVEPRSYPSGPGVLDLGGRLLLPGLVDLHNDAIEREINPRPGAEFAPTFALLQLDRKLAAAGVTTEFHAVSFSERESTGRSLEFAARLCEAVRELRAGNDATVEHHVLFRLDVRTPGSLDALLPALDGASAPLLSLNDHVPGQGQFRDLPAYRRYLTRFLAGEASEQRLDDLIEQGLRRAAATEHLVAETLTRVAAAAREHDMILMSHDDDTPERVDLMRGLGCEIAEFPLTVEAAARAAGGGMRTAMGAANAFRGGSLSGNVGALDLLARGLVDVLVADYYAPAMLAAGRSANPRSTIRNKAASIAGA
jgi:alpha-D-ribose 1-methylphosphonate 5-triphosphate diphosphatase